MPRSKPTSLALAFFLSVASCGQLLAQKQAAPAGERIRGVTISTHGAGRDWGDAERMRATYRRLKGHGAEWVATHPYARIHGAGQVTWRRAREGAGAPAHWTVPIRVAHEEGLKILIKPHLAYWGSPFSWRGDIHFDSRADWARFFQDYERWILELARACKKADGFCVGCELDRTVDHEAAWRSLVAKVRRETKAPLTYAANWDAYTAVPFWDALDVIGIQAYFPLSNSEQPSAKELAAAWKQRMLALRHDAQRLRRNVVFTELGYNRSYQAARKPWLGKTDGPEAERLQARCLGVALDAIEAEDWVLGCFLWKWFPGPRASGRDFQLATPRLLHEIEARWKAVK